MDQATTLLPHLPITAHQLNRYCCRQVAAIEYDELL
jgi:hypothetical protein